MSEPLSSTEIEDVLSSIRRLVSEDMRPVPRSVASRAEVASVGGKLILTPALRVVEPTPTAARLHLNFPAEAGVPVPAEAASIEMVLASVGAAVDAGQDDWEDEADSFDAPHWGFADETPAGRDVPAWAQIEGDEDHAAAPIDEAPQAKVDPLWVAAAEASVIAALAEEDEPTSQSAAVPDDAFEESFAEEAVDFRFNEDVLRELVRDILREELAGSMGERITRNIRKLVRAEIARGLASQEFS